MFDQPLVSIITLNWNAATVTCEFLSSIKEQNTYKNIEVIVVDNASKQDDSELFLSVYPSVKIIRNNVNLGFSGGNKVKTADARGLKDLTLEQELIFFRLSGTTNDSIP